MKVKELIERLQKVDQDADVYLWDAYTDEETLEVHCYSRPNGVLLVSVEE